MAGSLIDGISNVLQGIFQSLLALLQLPIDVLSAIFKTLVDVVGHIGAVIFSNLMVIGVVVAAIYFLNNTRQGQQIKKKAS